MIVDWVYFTFDLTKKTVTGGIKLISGQLIGRKQSEDKMSYGERFKIDKVNRVTECVNDRNLFTTIIMLKKKFALLSFLKKFVQLQSY